MASVPAPSYITVAELRAQTLIKQLSEIGDGDIETLIQIAEDQIDAYVGPQEHHPDDINVSRIFPRLYDTDGNNEPAVPYQVARASLRQVEWLYTQWWCERETTSLPIENTVKQRSIGGDGSYSETLADGFGFSQATLCDQAKALLKDYVSRAAPLDVTDPDTVPLPT